MQRLGNTLRILASVLMGVLCRDFLDLEKGVQSTITGDGGDSLGAFLTVAVFIAICIRNIHGSAAYDDWVDEKKFVPAHERHVWGRVLSFLCALVGLFAGPFTLDFLLKHGPRVGVAWLCVLPFAPYVLWNFTLWWNSSGEVGAEREARVFSTRWLLMDFLWLATVIVVWIYARVLPIRRESFPFELTCSAFIVVGASTVVADYWFNSSYYFPPGQSTSAEVLRPVNK